MARKQLTFEEKLLALETLVEKMEGGNLSLEESLKAYETGMQLSRELKGALDDAEKRMLELSGGDLVPMEDAP